MRTYWKTRVVEVGGGGETFYKALNNPGGGLPALNGSESDPSYPVAVDPMGHVIGDNPLSNPSRFADWLGDTQTAFPRRNLSVITSQPLAQRTCTLMDTLGYTEDGVPTDDREMRYNWLWIIQRPNNTSQFTANMTIVVFDRRAHLYAPTGSEAVYPNVTANPGQSSLQFQSAPDVRPGAWILDASINVPSRPTIRHANFYRVTAVNGTQVELQSPIKTPSDGNTNQYSGTFIVLRGVSGVYTRSPLTAGD